MDFVSAILTKLIRENIFSERRAEDVITLRGLDSLQEWTGKKGVRIISDSEVDPFTDEGFFDTIKNKSGFSLIGSLEDGDVLGRNSHVSIQ